MLISGAAKIAVRLGLSSLLIGLTVVAFGTSMPELFVSLNASFSGHQDIMFGNVVGSNIANIGLILAISVLLAPLVVHFNRLALEFYLLIAAGLLLFALTLWGTFPRPVGLLFITLLVTYTVLSYRKEAKKSHHLTKDHQGQRPHLVPYPIISGLVLGGLVLMWFGSDYFIMGAVDMAHFFGLSDLIIGLTLAAVGTSLPELASCISAVRRREGDLLVGNIIGSNLFNILLVLGITAGVKPFSIPHQSLFRDLPVMLAYSIILIPIAIYAKEIKRWHGAALLTAYLFYIYSLG
jgi:cation:H+ antiporter